MFMGEYEHGLDEKGRIIVPTKFREALGEHFVLTLGTDGCLFIYPTKEWEQFVEKLKSLPGTKEARQMQRYFMAGAVECESDKQGRVMIPAKLREHAGITKDVVSVGVVNKIEIWSKERWESNNTYDSVDDIVDHMSDFGLSF
ncbi:MAG: division/cell wall cluster transcriptional repressor MraZ [Lachnospiraceae bacterium]|nr:division/cell wall cluster transcriptional repressor MraZ [Lachnospiraceae bacterium]